MAFSITQKITARHPLTKRNLEIHTHLHVRPSTTELIKAWAEMVVTDDHTPFICGTAKITAATMVQLQREAEHRERKAGAGASPEQETVQAPITPAMAVTNADRYRNSGAQRPFMHLSSPFERLLSPNAPEPTYSIEPLLGRVGIQYGGLADLDESSDMARGRVDRVGQQGASGR